jgi:hypothetical protein
VEARSAHETDATGVLFREQTPAALAGAVEQFEAADISPTACRAWAEGFSMRRFHEAMNNVLIDGLRETMPQWSTGSIVN